MKKILHIVTRPADELARSVIAAQQQADTSVDVVELPLEGADYAGLVDKVFEADSVEVW